jgi:hypothetical protein
VIDADGDAVHAQIVVLGEPAAVSATTFIRFKSRSDPARDVREVVMMGNADEVAARLRAFAGAGLEHVILCEMSSIACAPDDVPVALTELAKLTGLLHSF